MEKTFVLKTGLTYGELTGGGTIATQAEISDLAQGSMNALLYYSDGKVLPSNVAVPATNGIPEMMVIACGRKAGTLPHFTTPLYTNKFKVSKTTYQAGVAMVGVFGNDGLVAKSSGSFASGDIGNTYECTTVGTGIFGTYLTDQYGNVVGSGAGLVLGRIYTVTATGSPTWNSAVLTPTSINNALVVGTKVVGAEYGVTFVDLTKDINERRMWTISLPVLDASISNTQMLTNLVAAINAHPSVSTMGTATRIGATGFKFVGTDYTKLFSFMPTGLFAGTSVALAGEGLAVMGVPPIGAYAEVAESERRGSFSEGRVATNDKYHPLWTVEANAVAGTTYDCISITQKHMSGEKAYPNIMSQASESDILIYFPVGDRAAYVDFYATLQLLSDVASSQYGALLTAIDDVQDNVDDVQDNLDTHEGLEVGVAEGTTHPGA